MHREDKQQSGFGYSIERIIPGAALEQQPIYQKMLAMYEWAKQFAVRKTMLEAGCGEGYGAAKKAIVATQMGGVPKIVKDGSNGILVQAEDIEGLAKSIAYLHANADLRIIMGERSRKMVEERYTWEQISDKYLEVYQKVVHDAKIQAGH